MRISDWSSDVCSSDLSLYGTFDERSRIHDAEKGLQLFAVSLLETSQGGMGAPPWDDPERYLRNSPLMHVKAIETPIMLLSGDRDYRAEERRVGKECVNTCRSRWSPSN